MLGLHCPWKPIDTSLSSSSSSSDVLVWRSIRLECCVVLRDIIDGRWNVESICCTRRQLTRFVHPRVTSLYLSPRPSSSYQCSSHHHCHRPSDRLRSSLLARQHVVEIDLRDLNVYNEELSQLLQEKPGEMLPLLESALLKSARQILHPLESAGNVGGPGQDAMGGVDGGLASLGERDIPNVQAVLRSGMNMVQFRELTVSMSLWLDPLQS